MGQALRKHWPEYLMEAATLGLFMISACAFGIVLEHPASPLRQLIGNMFLRQALMGMAMGITLIGIIYSPWGQQSGAHMNPAVTLTFLRLGKVKGWDAVFYVIFQFLGGVAGVAVFAALFREWVAHPAVNYVATVPGRWGVAAALAGELCIAFLQMTMVLNATNRPQVARYTGIFAGILVAGYITFEAPLSGMSMNPARTFGSALSGNTWTALWIYFTAPLAGMFLAAEAYLRAKPGAAVHCAKLHHQNSKRCIFCRFGMEDQQPVVTREALATPKQA